MQVWLNGKFVQRDAAMVRPRQILGSPEEVVVGLEEELKNEMRVVFECLGELPVSLDRQKR